MKMTLFEEEDDIKSTRPHSEKIQQHLPVTVVDWQKPTNVRILEPLFLHSMELSHTARRLEIV